MHEVADTEAADHSTTFLFTFEPADITMWQFVLNSPIFHLKKCIAFVKTCTKLPNFLQIECAQMTQEYTAAVSLAFSGFLISCFQDHPHITT